MTRSSPEPPRPDARHELVRTAIPPESLRRPSRVHPLAASPALRDGRYGAAGAPSLRGPSGGGSFALTIEAAKRDALRARSGKLRHCEQPPTGV